MSADLPDSEGEEEYNEIGEGYEYGGLDTSRSNTDALREELAKYLEDLIAKKGSDGSTLIKVPSNFAAVADSMTREDVMELHPSGAPPWSQYLLLDRLNEEEDTEFGGRYSKIFRDTTEHKIRRGLAQIEMLDRQLKDVSRKGEKGRPVDTAEDPHDPTFVTENRLSGRSPRSAAHSHALNSTKSSARGPPQVEEIPPTVPSEREAQQAWLLGDIDADIGPEDLEMRLGSYWDAEEAAQIQALDAQLAQFGRLDRLGECAADPAAQDEQADPDDYLAQQRAEREAAEYEKKVDRLLQRCTNQSIDYDALVAGEQAEERAPSGRRKQRRAAEEPAVLRNEVPTLEEARERRSVTAADVRKLVAHLKEAASRGEEVVSSAHVQDLVRKYRAEVDALAKARRRLQGTPAAPTHCTEDRLLSADISAEALTDAPGAEEKVKIIDSEREWLLDWEDSAPPATISMAHPAVVPVGLAASAPATHLRNPVEQQLVDQYEDEQEQAQDVGWLPPLPPRSAEQSRESGSSGSARVARRQNGVTTSGSPNANRMRSPRGSEAAAPSTVFRASAERTGDLHGRQRSGRRAEEYGGAAQQRFQRDQGAAESLQRATRANNVLNNMSAFLSREVIMGAGGNHPEQRQARPFGAHNAMEGADSSNSNTFRF